MTREKALGIALGNISPISGEVIADFDPKRIKVCHRTCFWEHFSVFHTSVIQMRRGGLAVVRVCYFWPGSQYIFG